MNLFNFVFYLGVISVVFGLGWKWIVVKPVSLTKQKSLVYLAKAIGIYFLTAFFSLLVLAYMRAAESILYSLTGAFVLYLNLAHYDIEAWEKDEKESRFFLPVLGVSLALYVAMLFIPVLGMNLLTQTIFLFIDGLYQLTFFRWLLNVSGSLFLVLIFWHGALVSLGLVEGLTKKKDKANQ